MYSIRVQLDFWRRDGCALAFFRVDVSCIPAFAGREHLAARTCQLGGQGKRGGKSYDFPAGTNL